MSRPLRTVSTRYAEARRRNPSGTIELSDSDSDTESISTSMIETVNEQTRRASSADRGSPVSRPAAEDGYDSGSEYSTADDEEFVATPIGRSTTLQHEYALPSPYADNSWFGSNDSGIDVGGMSDTYPSALIAGPSSTTTAQERAAEHIRKNYGPRLPAESPRHLERFPDLGPEPMALVEAPSGLERIVGGSAEGVENVQAESGSSGIQENGITPAQDMSILERTGHLMHNNHVPRRPSTEMQVPATEKEVQTTNHSPSSSISAQQYRDAIHQSFHFSGSNLSINSQSTETSPIPGLYVNTNRSRPNGLSNGLPSSTGNGRPVTDNTSGLRPIKQKSSIFNIHRKTTEVAQLHAKGYNIDDTAKAFKEIEGRSKEESKLILGGHLDKIFGIAKPPSQYVDAERRVRFEETAAGPQGSTAETEQVVEASSMGGFVFMRLGRKMEKLRKAILGLGEKRGRTTERGGSRRGRPRRA